MRVHRPGWSLYHASLIDARCGSTSRTSRGRPKYGAQAIRCISSTSMGSDFSNLTGLPLIDRAQRVDRFPETPINPYPVQRLHFPCCTLVGSSTLTSYCATAKTSLTSSVTLRSSLRPMAPAPTQKTTAGLQRLLVGRLNPFRAMTSPEKSAHGPIGSLSSCRMILPTSRDREPHGAPWLHSQRYRSRCPPLATGPAGEVL